MKKYQLAVGVVADFAPIITFVVLTELVGFMVALKWLVVVALLSLVLEWFVAKRLPKFGLLASGTILTFGTMSIITQNEFYIIIKDTLYALSFAVVLLLGMLFNRSYLEVLFADYLAITERGWRILTFRWMVFFFFLAAVNEIARSALIPDTWIYYKFLAVFMTWVFGFYQFTLIRRERLEEANVWGLRTREST